MKFLFDSKKLCFKKPFGAVRQNEEICISVYIENTDVIKSVKFVYRKDEDEKIHYLDMNRTKEIKEMIKFSLTISFPACGLYFYRFEIHTENGILFVGKKNGKAEIGDWLSEWQLTVYKYDYSTPDWAKGGIMYQIFPDRFCRQAEPLPTLKKKRYIHTSWDDLPQSSSDFFGGNIKGIITKLSYLNELGVNIIYFNPIFESAENHRYSTGNYMKTDALFGTNEEFRGLCNKCHALGIKVIIDGVFSHAGADSIYFNKYGNYDSIGATNSKNSPYFPWFKFNEYPNKYESWWGFDNLPEINEKNESYIDFICGKNGVIKYWQNIGVSGWRLDVADELPDLFLESLYKASKEGNKDALIIGEVWEDASNKTAYGARRKYLLGKQMDSVMNYPFRSAIIDFVISGESVRFKNEVFSILENYPSPSLECLMNSISTHDTIRAITVFGVSHYVENPKTYKMSEEEYGLGKKRLLEATFLQFTLPGIPCIYYGDEVGLDGFRDPYCRKTYPYGKEDMEILSFYKSLANVRKLNKIAFTSPICFLREEDGFVMYQRGNLVCAINLGKTERRISSNQVTILFLHGKLKANSKGTHLFPHSMIIICLS